MKKTFRIAIISLMLLALVACSTNIHKVGSGAKGNNTQEARQWYVLFGLVPINVVDTNQMAGGATNYDIVTEQNIMDIVINFFTSMVTVTSRTVQVTK